MRCERPGGFEAVMPDGLARVGLSQLSRLDANLAMRRRIAAEYFREFAETPSALFVPAATVQPSYVRFPIRVGDKDDFFAFMKTRGIQAGMWFTAPVHPQGVDQRRAGYRAGACPHAEDAVRRVANLPCHPRMTLKDARRTAEAVRMFSREKRNQLEGLAPA
jgi:dTDP-4-amino-4,6-dideoxygalactose transaminase